MRYDELRHTQLLRNYCCGWGKDKSYYVTKTSISPHARRFLKHTQARRQRIWNKKLTEVEMNTLRESYSGPYRALLTEGCSSG